MTGTRGLLLPALLLLLSLAPSAAAGGAPLLSFDPPPGGGIAPDASFHVAIGGRTPLAKIRSLYVSLARDGRPVPVTARFRPGSRTITVTPDAPLARGARYRLLARCLAPDGPAMAEADYAVAAPPAAGPVRVAGTTPEDGALCDDERPAVEVRFDGRLMPARDGSRDGALLLLDGDEPVPGEVRESPDGDRLAFFPAVPLRTDRAYRARLAPGLRGITGEAISPRGWTFRLREDVFRIAGSFPDAKRPEIGSSDRLMLTFTAPLDRRRDPRDFVKVVDEEDLAVPGEFMIRGERTLLFIPAVAFRPGRHALLVSGDYPSRAGNALGRDAVIPFRVPLDEFNRWPSDAAKFNRWAPDAHQCDRWAPDAR